MGKTYQYTYHGDATVNLPLNELYAEGGDTKTVHNSASPINHPDFKQVSTQDKDGKERKHSA